jgi:hypothetical protein
MLLFMTVATIPTHARQTADQLLDADRRLSIVAGSQGVVAALSRHLSNDGVVFPLSGHPINRAQILEVASAPKTGWRPLIAFVSSDHTFGHTSGSYTLNGKRRYYGIAWIKESDSWRVAVAMGFPVSLSSQTNPEPSTKPDFGPTTSDVVRAERRFAAYARLHGIPAAFFNFIASNGIALSSSGLPRHRSDYEALAKKTASAPTPPSDLLEWGPLKSRIAGSGDLAYNFGPYRYSYLDKHDKKQSAYGYFFTIWQKKSDEWKFLFDGGNTCQKLSDHFLKEVIHHDN